LINADTNLTARGPTVNRLNVGHGILSLDVHLVPQESGRLGPVRGVLRKAACEIETVREFARRFKDFNCAGDGVINSLIEQAPDRNNRVTLSNDVDEFGLRRAHVHWVLGEADRRTVRALGFELAKELLALDVARVQLSAFITDTSKEIPVWGHAHQMGTTRMAAEPRYGVVDANCQVHGVGNLYVAGSSVFPTGGGINPTLTIVMLSLRLAKYLRATG
jgi:choline dehydrogenase-like flavoprotein